MIGYDFVCPVYRMCVSCCKLVSFVAAPTRVLDGDGAGCADVDPEQAYFDIIAGHA
jgi:hypothetical protein